MAGKTQLHGNWNYPTSIRFGGGRINELPAACEALGMANPLLITDKTLAALPMVDSAVGSCHAAGVGCAVFSDVQGNPISKNVSEGVAAYRAGGHDGVIAFGGGSALDVGKAVGLMVGQARTLWDFEDREDWYTRVDTAAMAPVVAVPTTAGTGSEVGRASVIIDERDNTKKIIFHPEMLPDIVIADPELTIGLPPDITAWVGMDALSHNLEALCSPVFHPMAHGIALEGIRLVKTWLETAVVDGENVQARAYMLVASTMGATAFQKGLGAMHALSHPAGSVLGTHHGLTNAVVMPYVLKFNHHAVEHVLSDAARYLGLAAPSFDAILNWIIELRGAIGIPNSLKELGVDESHIDRLAPMAAVDPSGATNPVPLTAEKLARLYRSAINGDG